MFEYERTKVKKKSACEALYGCIMVFRHTMTEINARINLRT